MKWYHQAPHIDLYYKFARVNEKVTTKLARLTTNVVFKKYFEVKSSPLKFLGKRGKLT